MCKEPSLNQQNTRVRGKTSRKERERRKLTETIEQRETGSLQTIGPERKGAREKEPARIAEEQNERFTRSTLNQITV